ncbi:MAG: hypothetical protein AAB426_09845 [Myxococcota bacterium]
MKLQHLSATVSLLVVAGLVSAAAGEALHALASADRVGRSEGSSCPDPGDDGNPCGPACPCVCCPGHLTAGVLMSPRPIVDVPASDDLIIPWRDALHSKDVLSRIFHPPRA